MTTDEISWLEAPETTEREDLPAMLEPMMLTHLALTGDMQQYRDWRDRVENIEHGRALEDAPDSQSRAILEDKEAWLQMRTTGKLGAAFGLGLGLLWLSTLVPFFAVAHGIGLWALVFFLPLPIAWRVGQKLWEDAALAGMKDVGRRPTLRRRIRALAKAIVRGFGAGFGFGFTMTFLQFLLTWFFNAAPSLLAELASDTLHATIGGTVFGCFGMLLAPLVARGSPAAEMEESRLLEGEGRPALPDPDEPL
jgi:hypothetical protein